MQRDDSLPRTGPDLAEWEAATTGYRARVNGVALPASSNQRTEEARARLADAAIGSTTVVDLYIDPLCPYTWVVACWLREVSRQCELEVRYHVMSLLAVNAGGALEDRYRQLVGPSRVAMAVQIEHGPAALRTWHNAFGHQMFDYWRQPDPAEYQAAVLDALAATGLPTDLADAAGADSYDEALRRSTDEALLPVGVDVGTPVIHLYNAGFFGPVLNAVPLGAAALRLFDGIRLLAGSTDFFELKRSRTSPPNLRYRPDDGGGKVPT